MWSFEAFPTAKPQSPYSDGRCDHGPAPEMARVGRETGTYFLCRGDTFLASHVTLTWPHGRAT